ncbi:hypothetical protein [Oxynema aestuarii]|uniref:Uncharacterized protein n=1 Tax=Oxynema aestuarii AP17 TaxID=2064643 RepID=A0A6H1TUD8_9CYAN|nr:hypothetical protein [Oxynema aestuarii]QIZ69373.1 hypothetical protein HCG48_01215 [Oxynema aestuarii AP17]
MKSPNPYLEQVWAVLPRLLALYDTNPLSPTYGMGDRYRWAWKLIDFGNGTFQGAAQGLARLLKHNLLPNYLSQMAIERRIDALFRGADRLRYPNGSFEEAFPFESSFCVTALVAYDLLTAIELLKAHLDLEVQTRYLDIIRPAISFLHQADESHAFISNHLATAAVALYKWSALTNEPGEKRGEEILERILSEQSPEGWFREYEGADPGYQSLATYYLADLHRLRPDLDLLDSLRRSIQFLWHFAHPDGSFGGYYGSRNTRFYYPAGLEALAPEIPEAASLAKFMGSSIQNLTTVTLAVIDEPNLIPMFNAYCWAASLYEGTQEHNLEPSPELPALSNLLWRRQFPEAGLLIDKGTKHYTIVSWHKGGVCYHFPSETEKSWIDVGMVAISPNGHYVSSQAYQAHNSMQLDGDILTVTAPLVAMHQQLPSLLQFIILRLLNVTIMRSLLLGNLVKKILVRLLITGQRVAPVSNRRTIHLGANLNIKDSWKEEQGKGFNRIEVKYPFSAIHMASQGYWQLQDDIR